LAYYWQILNVGALMHCYFEVNIFIIELIGTAEDSKALGWKTHNAPQVDLMSMRIHSTSTRLPAQAKQSTASPRVQHVTTLMNVVETSEYCIDAPDLYESIMSYNQPASGICLRHKTKHPAQNPGKN
jgi:hypothetical protein